MSDTLSPRSVRFERGRDLLVKTPSGKTLLKLSLAEPYQGKSGWLYSIEVLADSAVTLGMGEIIKQKFKRRRRRY